MLKKSLLMLTCLVLAGFVSMPGWAGPVDLNSADAETIARELSGIGVARAQAIVEYREQYGAFASPDELLNVSGIGPHILQANKANIVLSQAD